MPGWSMSRSKAGSNSKITPRPRGGASSESRAAWNRSEASLSSSISDWLSRLGITRYPHDSKRNRSVSVNSPGSTVGLSVINSHLWVFFARTPGQRCPRSLNKSLDPGPVVCKRSPGSSGFLGNCSGFMCRRILPGLGRGLLRARRVPVALAVGSEQDIESGAGIPPVAPGDVVGQILHMDLDAGAVGGHQFWRLAALLPHHDRAVAVRGEGDLDGVFVRLVLVYHHDEQPPLRLAGGHPSAALPPAGVEVGAKLAAK